MVEPISNNSVFDWIDNIFSNKENKEILLLVFNKHQLDRIDIKGLNEQAKNHTFIKMSEIKRVNEILTKNTILLGHQLMDIEKITNLNKKIFYCFIYDKCYKFLINNGISNDRFKGCLPLGKRYYIEKMEPISLLKNKEYIYE